MELCRISVIFPEKTQKKSNVFLSIFVEISKKMSSNERLSKIKNNKNNKKTNECNYNVNHKTNF